MRTRHLWLAVLLAAVLARLLTLSAYPLYDTTEARYAEIARLMVVSGDWITPQIDMGVPFWAKPPLSTWLTAASFKMLGFSEFAARLPAFLLMLVTALVTFRFGRTLFSDKAAIVACAILFTSALGFVAAGAVMTDAALLLSTTLSLASFGLLIREPNSIARYGFFVGLGLGLLAKGPIALLLVGLPVLIWTLWFRKLLWLWHEIPWLSGSALMLVIAVPWYLLAEINTPGFLEYFLIGEHWLRFVESGWQGDLYGSAHAQPRGTIWLYAIAAALPWSIFAIYAIAKGFKSRSISTSLTPVQGLLLLWALAPILFFTFAGNILAAYVLPGLPAFALLLGDWLSRRSYSTAHAGWLVPGLIVAAAMSGFFDAHVHKSQQGLIDYYYQNSASSTLYYFPVPPHSATFYSRGRVRSLQSDKDWLTYLATENAGSVAMRKRKQGDIPSDAKDCMEVERQFYDYVLMHRRDAC
ncbi:MAG: glycosyltransferase family 39 protein [Gammaproteobacteria bacterium]|nr:glycosyltransferase family 39 protein [Gammaproteobacteria bacterium]